MTDTDTDTDEDEDDELENEGTLFYNAQDGTLRDEDGDEFTLEMLTDDTTSEEREEEEAEGTQTPRAASAAGPSQATAERRIRTSTSPPANGNIAVRVSDAVGTVVEAVVRFHNSAVTKPVRFIREHWLTSSFFGCVAVTQHQIIQILSHAGMRNIWQPSAFLSQTNTRRARLVRTFPPSDDSDMEEGDDDDDGGGRQRAGMSPGDEGDGDAYPKIPSAEGEKLMQSGTFGVNDRRPRGAMGLPFSQATLRKRRTLARRLLDRELGIAPYASKSRTINALAAQSLLPSSRADMIINFNAPCYSGQFSDDGSFFFACGRDFKVRMYDTSNPYDWKYYKTVHCYAGQWTITDASLSPNNKLIAYSTIRPQVSLANTEKNDTSEPRTLDFSPIGRGRGHHTSNFGIWSIRFSGDGREVIAGSSDYCIYAYDLQAQCPVLRIHGHSDDVNAVCFGDKSSPHIIYSGSDDTVLKVWDRRSLASERPAGMFHGHTEGLTYIDSKGDGRYVISNAKDQTCKLWDLRKMISTETAEKIDPQHYTTHFDYRFQPYDTSLHKAHPYDCSLVTFRGHRVLRTLIRCHFSPPTSTDSRYIYSGSHDGKVYIWNLDGTTARVIDVKSATRNSRPLSDERHVDQYYDYHGGNGVWRTIVRDCSWHPSAPMIAATSWNGWDHGLGTCTVHSWNDGDRADEIGGGLDERKAAAEANTSLGSSPMGIRLTAELKHDARFYASDKTRHLRNHNPLGLTSVWADNGEDDEE